MYKNELKIADNIAGCLMFGGNLYTKITIIGKLQIKFVNFAHTNFIIIILFFFLGHILIS